jgi:hypothetical protein
MVSKSGLELRRKDATVASFRANLPFWNFPGLPFDPEDGGDMFLRNVYLSPNFTVLHLRRPHSSERKEFRLSSIIN